MEFTNEEILKLKDVYKYSFIHKRGVSQTLNQGFGYWGLILLNDGRIKEYWSKPLDIDCDDGSVDKYDAGEKYYENFEQLMHNLFKNKQ